MRRHVAAFTALALLAAPLRANADASIPARASHLQFGRPNGQAILGAFLVDLVNILAAGSCVANHGTCSAAALPLGGPIVSAVLERDASVRGLWIADAIAQSAVVSFVFATTLHSRPEIRVATSRHRTIVLSPAVGVHNAGMLIRF